MITWMLLFASIDFNTYLLAASTIDDEVIEEISGEADAIDGSSVIETVNAPAIAAAFAFAFNEIHGILNDDVLDTIRIRSVGKNHFML